jgi:hypothetical protein
MPNSSRKLWFLSPLFLFAVACGGGGGDKVTGTTVGPPASVTKVAGDAQSTTPSATVSIAPSVIVKDASGNAVAGATVTFAVASGGGTVTGATATSSASGTATVGSWTVGPIQGDNTLTATVTGVTPATFTATATCPTTVYTFGTSINGSVALTDCQDNGGFYTDWYGVTLTNLASGNAYTFTQTSASFRSTIYVFRTSSPLQTTFANVLMAEAMGPSQTTMTTKLILPAGGNFLVGITTFAAGVTGAYSLTSAIGSEDATLSGGLCDAVWVAPGITTNQSLATTDCNYASVNSWLDTFAIPLVAGQTITVSMNSTALDAYLDISKDPDFGPPVTIVATNDNRAAGTTNAQITYTPTTTGYYMIRARSAVARQTGSYTLIVQ